MKISDKTGLERETNNNGSSGCRGSADRGRSGSILRDREEVSGVHETNHKVDGGLEVL